MRLRIPGIIHRAGYPEFLVSFSQSQLQLWRGAEI